MSIIKENLEIAKLNLERLRRAREEIEIKNILESLDVEDFESVKVIDTFIFRFIKLQDYLCRKLFRRFLDAIGELFENMSFIDILDKLEKLGIIESTEEWLEIRRLRNRLTHDYPQELEEIKEEIKIAMSKVNILERAIINMEKYLSKRALI